jgi:hypothetical protein
MLRVTGGNVPGNAFAEAESAEEPKSSCQIFLSVPALSVGVGEYRWYVVRVQVGHRLLQTGWSIRSLAGSVDGDAGGESVLFGDSDPQSGSVGQNVDGLVS